MIHYASRFDLRTACRKDIAHESEVTIRRERVTCEQCRWRISPPRACRSSESRVSTFVRDASKRSRWADPVALLRFSITSANEALMERWR